MARRRAASARTPARVEWREDLPPSARVAWAYLSSLIAAVGAGALALLATQTLAVGLCRGSVDGDIADCKLGWAIWSSVAAFLLLLVPIAWRARLGWWFSVVMWAGVGWWVASDAIDQWWWWAAAIVLPAVAALLSADWDRGARFRRVQLGVVVAALVGAVSALIWWYLHG